MPLHHRLLIAALTLLSADAFAAQAGWRQISVPGILGNSPTGSPATVALYYPTQAKAMAIPMGPFTAHVAPQAEPEAAVKGLIVLSHGTGGSELGHTSLAEALAQSGYLVAALRHPGDNWQDRSLLKDNPAAYFNERPQQVSRVIDALLADPQWKARIASDERGPRIGALGHSAGGYTVLALAGGQPDVSLIGKHCAAERADDPIFCAMGAGRPSVAAVVPLLDPRVRAVVAMAPVGVVFDAASLAAIRVPTRVFEAEQDRFLVPRFHAERIAQSAPQLQLTRVPNAGHFAFMDTPGMPIPSEDGDIGANPPGFDRAAFLQQLQRELISFFDEALR